MLISTVIYETLLVKVSFFTESYGCFTTYDPTARSRITQGLHFMDHRSALYHPEIGKPSRWSLVNHINMIIKRHCKVILRFLRPV